MGRILRAKYYPKGSLFSARELFEDGLMCLVNWLWKHSSDTGGQMPTLPNHLCGSIGVFQITKGYQGCSDRNY